MAGWVKLAGRSFVGAVLVGAAQLGAAQALAILVWSTVPTTDVWRRQLTWLVLIFAAAVLGGVVTGRRSVRTIRRAIANRRADAAAARHAGLVVHQRGLIAAQRRAMSAARGKTVDTARGVAAGAARVCATVFAALGAATAFALVWLPARNAYDSADLRVLAVAAGLGVVVGAVLSLLCLTAAPVAANVGVSLAGVWLFGLASVGMTIATDEPTITPRLGVLDAPKMIGPDEWWLGPNLMVAVAAILGFAVAATARWIGAHRLSIALSGLAGPTVVAAAYLLVGPAGDLLSSYVAALLAATVGLLTSAATAATNRGTAEEPTTGRTPAALTAGPAAAPRRPLAIESAPAAQHPAAQYPAAQYPAAAHHPGAPHTGTPQPSPAYADVAYAGASSRKSKTGRPEPGRATPPLRASEPAYASAEPLYVAPPRSAPVPPARKSPPAQPHRSMPPAAPAPPVPAWPMAPPTQYAAPAPPIAPPTAPGGRPAPPSAPPPPPVAAAAAPPAPPAAPPAPSTASPAAKTGSPAAKPPPTRPAPPPAPPAQPAVVPPPVPPVAVAQVAPAQRRPDPEPSRRGRKAAKGKSTPAQPTPVQPAAVQPAAAQPAATGRSARRSAAGKAAATETAATGTAAGKVTADKATADKATPDKPAGRGRRGRADRATPQPRTTRPVEVVAVEASRPSHDAIVPTPKGRLARRRAAKLAAERAEAEAQLRRLMEREAITMNKREREHVDWVKHLVSLPDDPTLTTRQK